MKILKIELQNINSLKSKEPIVIDFESENFQDVGLFAITGPTGSGKTTILDAITIALYHQVPRFKQSNIKAGLEDVVSYGASEAMTRLSFENNHIRYEAFWHIRLMGSNGKKLNKAVETVRIKNLSEEKILGEKKKNVQAVIEDITQLKYDQFLRSMMLAQGEFASFLSAKSKDKAALLEQITGEEIYKRIGEAIQQKIREENKKLEDIKAKINAEDILDREQEEGLKKEDKQLEVQLLALEQEGRKYDNIRTWYNKQKSLEENIKKLENDARLWQQEKEQKQTILVALEQYHKAEPFKENLHELSRLESDIQDNISNNNKLSSELKSLVSSIIETKKAVKESSEKVSSAEKNWTIWLPKLEKLYRLDMAIESLEQERLRNETQLKDTKKKIGEFQTEIKRIEEQKGREALRQNELNDFLKQNDKLPLIETKIRGWAVQLANYKTVARQLNKELKTVHEQQNRHSELINILKEENTKAANKRQDISLLNSKLETITASLELLDFETLIDLQTSLNERKQELNKLYTISQEYENKSLRKTQLMAKKTNAELELKSKAKELITNIQKIALASDLLRETEKSLYQEMRIHGLEEERKRLAEGEACPLCGSTHHPAIEKYAKIKVSLTEKRLQERKESLVKLEESKRKIDLFVNRLKLEINNYTTEIETLDLQKIHNQFVHPNLKITNPVSIKQALTEIDKEIKNIKQKSKDFQHLQQQKETISNSLKRHTEKLHTIDAQLSQKKEELKNLNSRIEEGKLNILNFKEKINELTNPLKEEFKQFDLLFPDSQEIEYFIQNLEKKVRDYSNKEQELIKLKNVLTNLVLELNNQINQKAEKQKIVNKIKKEQDQNTIKLNETLKQRESILPLSISPAQKRKDLQEKIKKTKAENQTAQEKHIQTAQEKAIKEKELSNLNKNLLQLKQEIDQKSRLFEKSIKDSSFDSRKEIESSLLNRETEVSYKEIKKQLENKYLQIKTLRTRSEQELTHLWENKDFTITEEEMLEKEEERKLKTNITTERRGEIRSKLQLDKQIKERNKEVFKEIEKQTYEWEKWKELIRLLGGSKDAFNTYVQRLTLQNLIQRANLHLNHLNPRYSLQMNPKYKTGEELNFHLIDHYQIDQTRLVETSSGGEKFLISLALALGLSDIASKNVNVESLFIDEGFGTLDQATLEVVISTLESLHAQGKRIGIISHVETLKNRISTQIQVSRKGNGVSELIVM